MSITRAKVRVSVVRKNQNDAGEVFGVEVRCNGVSKPKYDADGLDEDNTFAKFSPSVDFYISIQNPALFSTLEVGQTYYLDLTEAPA